MTSKEVNNRSEEMRKELPYSGVSLNNCPVGVVPLWPSGGSKVTGGDGAWRPRPWDS